MLINIWNDEKEIIKEGNDFTPYISVHKAENSIGKAIMIIPGGGYHVVCDDFEGVDLAEIMNAFGIDCFVLRYRVAPNFTYPCPYEDAARAMRYVRFNMEKLGMNFEKLGVMGFSAGGHLASWVSNCPNEDFGNDDLFEKVSARPDFCLLSYPVTGVIDTNEIGQTFVNLLGDKLSNEMIEKLSPYKLVNKNTPPTFLYHCFDDVVVPCNNSILYYQAMIKNKVPGELHVFKPGPHGTAFGTSYYATDNVNPPDYLYKCVDLIKNWVLYMV